MLLRTQSWFWNPFPLQSYKEKDAGKVVVYTTTMGIVRETYNACAKVKQILRTLLIKYEERDVFMSSEYQAEIKERMRRDCILVPQVFVDGQHIGVSLGCDLPEIGGLGPLPLRLPGTRDSPAARRKLGRHRKIYDHGGGSIFAYPDPCLSVFVCVCVRVCGGKRGWFHFSPLSCGRTS